MTANPGTQASGRRQRKLRLPGVVEAVSERDRFVLIACMVLLYWSYAGLGRDVFFNKLNDPTAYDPIGAVLNYVRLLFCVLAVAVVTLNTTFNWALSRVPLQFAPFMAFALASILWSDDPSATYQNAVLICTMWIALSMVIHRLGAVDTVRTTLHIIAAVCIASFLLAVFVPGIGRHTGLEAVQSVHAGRWRGIFSHKNGLGPWAAYGSVFLFTHSWMAGGSRYYWWFARFAAVSCLIFSQSSTSVVIALVLLVGWLVFRLLRTYSGGAVAALLGLVAAVVGAVYAFAGETIFDLLGRDMTFTGRTTVWEYAWRALWQRPLTGHGYQSLGGQEFLTLISQNLFQAIPGAESGYMTLLLDLGFIGFVLFFVPFLMAIRNGLEWLPYVGRTDRAAIEFMLLTLFCVLVHAITETGALVAVGFDGVISFGALFFLATLPRSPASILRRASADKRRRRGRRQRLARPGGQFDGSRTLGDVV